MRSAAIVALLAAACSSAQPSPPPPADPTPPPPPPPESPDTSRVPAVAEDHPLYGRVEGKQSAGECSADSACVVGGCSAEVCSTEQVQTTCEARQWPTRGATCGCVEGQCIWYTGGEPVDDGPRSGVPDKLDAFKNEMCACTDSDCAEAVNKRFEAWLADNREARGDTSQKQQVEAAVERYGECMKKAMTEAPTQAQKCGAGDRCAPGLTCVKYYGVAGAAGPEFRSCEILCGEGKPACPDGQSCKIISDGPGQVCRP